MGRTSIYATAAERQKAYRERAASRVISPVISAPPKPKKRSRPARLVAAENDIRTLLEEYEDWRGRIPEALEDTAQAQSLDDAIEKLTDAAELLAGIEPPRGFGRD
jgi:predicted RNase H-like HicB family nuclease